MKIILILYILFVPQTQSECSGEASNLPLADWKIIIIVVGSIIGVAILFIIISLAIPSLRKKSSHSK